MTDFTLIDNEGNEYKVYKGMLFMIPFFEIMFKSGMEESNTDKLKIDYSAKVVSTFLERFQKREKLINLKDFSLEYLDFIRFLLLEKDIEIFNKGIHKKSKIYIYRDKYRFSRIYFIRRTTLWIFISCLSNYFKINRKYG